MARIEKVHSVTEKGGGSREAAGRFCRRGGQKEGAGNRSRTIVKAGAGSATG